MALSNRTLGLENEPTEEDVGVAQEAEEEEEEEEERELGEEEEEEEEIAIRSKSEITENDVEAESIPTIDIHTMELEDLLIYMANVRFAYKLITALDIETLRPGDPNGAALFIKSLEDLRSNKDGKSEEMANTLASRDMEKIMEIVITLDRTDILAAVLNHPYLPRVTCSDPLIISSLRKAIRSGKLHVLNYLIQHQVQLFSNPQTRDKDMQTLMFQIVKAVEIGYKEHRMASLQTADIFFDYFLQKCYEFTFQQNINEIVMATVPNTVAPLSSAIESYQRKHRVGMELRKSIPNLPMIQNSIIYSFRQLSHTTKYFRHCWIHLQFLREKYILFRIPTLETTITISSNSSNLKMETMSSYEKPLVMPKLEESYRGSEWNIFWMHHLLMLIRDAIRSTLISAKKQKIKISSSSASKLTSSNISSSSEKKQESMEIQLKEMVEDMGMSIEYLISGGVAFSQQMKDLIESSKKEELAKIKQEWIVDLLINYIQQGCHNWDIRLLSSSQMTNLFAGCMDIPVDVDNPWSELPIDIIKFILSFVTL